MEYRVKTLRDAGLKAKWSRTKKGAPIIVAQRNDDFDKTWYTVDKQMWERAEKVGIAQAFDEHTCLGFAFSIPI